MTPRARCEAVAGHSDEYLHRLAVGCRIFGFVFDPGAEGTGFSILTGKEHGPGPVEL